MNNKMNPALEKAVKTMGDSLTPEDLIERGVRRVRSVPLREVSRMIERAVNQTLMERTLNVDRAELRRLVKEAKHNWIQLLASHNELQESRGRVEEQREELEEVLESLHQEPQRGPGAAGSFEQLEEQKVVQATDDDRRLATELRRSIRTLGKDEVETKDVEDAVIDQVLAVLTGVRQQAADEREKLHTQQIAQLERRVAKLLQSLEETSEVLRRVSAAKAIDSGLPSLYRVVQGLSNEDENMDLKKELMSAIFEANMSLREPKSA
jgi:hypothetical protein